MLMEQSGLIRTMKNNFILNNILDFVAYWYDEKKQIFSLLNDDIFYNDNISACISILEYFSDEYIEAI